MKSILVATDFSRRSDPAINRGATLAKAHDAKLTIAHVVDDDQSKRLADAAQNEAAKILDALSASMRNHHEVSAKIIVTCGDPHVEILEAAKSATADIIVVGSHRRNIVRNTFVGTTAERSIRAGNLPVLVARNANGADYTKPAIALDFAEGDLTPLTTATKLNLFNIQSAKLVFAFYAGNYHLIRQSGASDRELKQYFDNEKRLLFPRIEKLIEGVGVQSSQVVLTPELFGEPDAILEIVSAEKADLIVVGTRRKTAIDKLRLGSVSEAILRRAEVDVLVIPPA